MATEEGDKVGLKRKLTGPARLLLLGKTRKGSESRANRRQASGGVGGGGGVSGTQEEVREEAEVCSGVDIQTTRGSCFPDEEEQEEASRGTRKTQKGVWRRVFSPAFNCFRRRRRPRPESSTPGCPGELMGPSGRGAKGKRRFPGLTWPPPLFRHLLTSSREQEGGAGPRSAGEDAGEPHQQLNVSSGVAGQLCNAKEWTDCSLEGDKPEWVALENNNDGNVACLSEVVLEEAEDRGHGLEHRSELDAVVMEMSVQEPEAATESQLGCSGLAAEGDPQWPGPHAPEQRPTDGSRDPAENHLTRPSTDHNELINAAMAAANELLDDKANPSEGSSEEEEAIAAGLSNGLHRVGVGVAMVTDDHLAPHGLSSVDAVIVVPLIRLNSGGEESACDWEAAPVDEAPVDEAPLEDGVVVEVDWEVKGGGGGDGDELVLSAHAVVRAAMLAAVQQLLREQQSSVDHVHHHDPHHLSPNPY